MPRYDDYTSLRFDQTGDVLCITLDNPRTRLNTVDAQMHDELRRLFEDLKGERDARAVLLTGEGKAFSAGGDFGWMRGVTTDDLLTMRKEGKELIWNLLDVELPIVAAINGPAVGLGATLALLCDTIFIGRSATIADPHVRVGIAAGDGGAVIWPLVVGPTLAKRYLMTGDAIDADTAARLGLVTHVSEDDVLQEEALKFAAKLAAGAPLAVRYTKAAVNQLVKQAMTTAFDYSTALEVLTFVSADHREALRAFEAKETPVFEGR